MNNLRPWTGVWTKSGRLSAFRSDNYESFKNYLKSHIYVEYIYVPLYCTVDTSVADLE